MSESERYPHPKCADVSVLESELRLHKEAWEKELLLFRDYVNLKFHDQNQLRTEVVSDRIQYFTVVGHNFFADGINKELKELRKTIEKNSDRLLSIESLGETKESVDQRIATLKEFHDIDLVPVKKKLEDLDKLDLPAVKKSSDGHTRLVWIGIGVAITAQVFLHYFFLRQVPIP